MVVKPESKPSTIQGCEIQLRQVQVQDHLDYYKERTDYKRWEDINVLNVK